MNLRIGSTLAGRVVGYDTTSARPMLLVGDVGRGKTTTARHLTRWWLATGAHAHVYSQAPNEWADLPCETTHPDHLCQQVGACQARTCLVVVDDIDGVGERLGFLPWWTRRMILTSRGGNSLTYSPLTYGPLLEADIDCVGLVHPDGAAESAVMDGQGRLDWPIDTVAIIADQRGPNDFPCHRWQAPTQHPMGVAQ